VVDKAGGRTGDSIARSAYRAYAVERWKAYLDAKPFINLKQLNVAAMNIRARLSTCVVYPIPIHTAQTFYTHNLGATTNGPSAIFSRVTYDSL